MVNIVLTHRRHYDAKAYGHFLSRGDFPSGDIQLVEPLIRRACRDSVPEFMDLYLRPSPASHEQFCVPGTLRYETAYIRRQPGFFMHVRGRTGFATRL